MPLTMNTKRVVAAAATAFALVLVVAPTAGAAGPGLSTGKAHRADFDDVRAATAAYSSLKVAKSVGGYTTKVIDLAGLSCIADPNGSGAMGVHFVNASLLTDGAIDALTPESMIYARDSDGVRHLVAVEYLVFRDAWDAAHAQPPRLFGRSFELIPAGNRYGLPDFYELHAWVWKFNPSGAFADWNPRVHCP